MLNRTIFLQNYDDLTTGSPQPQPQALPTLSKRKPQVQSEAVRVLIRFSPLWRATN